MPDETKTQIRIRPETRGNLDSVCAVKGWTLTEAADRAVSRLIDTDPELEPLRNETQQTPTPAN